MSYEWLLFDADNTLFDYDRAETVALRSTFADFSLAFDVPHATAYRKINAQIWHEYENGLITQDTLRAERFKRLFAGVGIETNSEAFSERYLQNLADSGFLIDGAAGLIQALYGRYKLAIITNGIGDVQHPRLRRSPIVDYIETMIVSGDLGMAKPDPAIFDAAFARMGHPDKSVVLIIGDSLTSDMRGGVNYGIDTCWYNPDGRSRPADLPLSYEISELQELLEILENSRKELPRHSEHRE